MTRAGFFRLFTSILSLTGCMGQNSQKSVPKASNLCGSMDKCPFGHCQPSDSDAFWLNRDFVSNGPIASATRAISCDTCGVLYIPVDR
jgi:hypothetical protein